MAKDRGWKPEQKRWVRKINGVIKARSARQLARDYPDLVSAHTKQGTVKAANKHFAKVKLEMDAAAGPAPQKWQEKFQPALQLIQRKLDYYTEHEEEGENWLGIKIMQKKIDELAPLLKQSSQPPDKILEELLGIDFFEDQWSKRLNPDQISKGTIADKVVIYLEAQKNRFGKVGKKGLELDSYKNKERYINFTKNLIGSTSVEDFNEETVVKVSNVIAKKKVKDATKFCYQNTFWEFIKFMHKNSYIENLPRNYRDELYSYSPEEEHEPDPPPKEAVQYLMKAIRAEKHEMYELCCLLHLNCGAYIADIEGFTVENFDEDIRTIFYKRKKNLRYKIKGTTYPLWGRTFELIKKFKTKSTRKKHPLIEYEFPITKNGISKQFKKFRDKFAPDYEYSMMDLRKTGADSLNKLEFSDCVKPFNQRSNKGTDEKYYLSDIFQKRWHKAIFTLEEYLEL